MKNMGLPFAGWMSDEDCAPMMLVATDTSISASGLVYPLELHAVQIGEQGAATTIFRGLQVRAGTTAHCG